MSEYAGIYDAIKGGMQGIATILSQPKETVPQNIQHLLSGAYYDLIPSNKFMQFNTKNSDADAIEKHGWKFHMSVAPEQTGKALEIMLDEFKKSGHTGAFKVATENTLKRMSDPNADQSGKIFTIYDDGKSPEQTKKLVQKLEERFQAEGIKPGPAVKGDRTVPGSSYSSYRNDRTANGSYSADKSNYNISNRPDPYGDMAIQKQPQQSASPKPNAPKEHYITLAQAEATHTSKGVYLGVGKGPEEIAKITDALKQSGFKDSDFKVRHSNAFGGNVIEMSGEAGTRFMTGQAKLRESGVHLETPQAHTPVNQPAAQPVAPPKPPPVAAPVDLDLSQPAQPKPAAPSAAPAQPSQTAKPAAPAAAAVAGVDIDIGKPVTAETAMADAKARAREQLNALNAEKPQHHLDKASENARAQLAGVGGKVDAKLGKASIAAEAATHLASGDVAGAVKSTAEAVATQAAIKTGVGFVAKRIPGIGAVVTLGMTLWSAGAEAAQGNYKKAGAELLAGGAEAAGNIVGFGAGDVAREIARGGIIAAGGPAAEKSQARQMGENIISAGKTVVDKAKFGSMDQKTLASTIASDPALHKTVNRGGVATPLADALKDKTFRADYLKTLENQTKSGQYDRSTQIAAIKAYGEKVDASAPAQAAATPVKPAAVAQAASPAAPAASAQQVAQYKAMGTAELGRTIQKDDVLPDKVKIGGKEMDLADALKDKSFRQEMLKNMESAQAKGTDMSTQIAMVKAYGDKIEIEQRRPTVTASAPAPSITAPMA